MSNDTIKTIFCSQCGTKNDINANFCTSCGNKLIKPANVHPPVIEDPAPEETAPVVIPEPEAPGTPLSIEDEPVAEPVAAPVVEPEPAPVIVEEPVEEEAAEEEPVIVAAPGAPLSIDDEPVAEPAVEPEPEPVIAEEPAVIPALEIETDAPAYEEPNGEPEFVPAAAPSSPISYEAEPEPTAPLSIDNEPESEPEPYYAPAPVIEEPPVKKKGKEKPVKEKKVKEKQVKEKQVKEKKVKEKKQKKAEYAPAPAPYEDKTVSNNSYYYYNTPDNNVPPEKPKKKRRQNFFLKILSFLLALMLTAALALALPITLLNLFLTDHNIEIIVDHTVSTIELEELKFATADGTKSLSGVLLDITDEFEGWDHITEEQINDALLEDFVKQFVTDTLKRYGMSLKEGEQILGWTPEQIYDFVEANKETIEQLAREAGYEGKLPIEEKKDMMIANIEQKIGKDGISANTIFGNTSEADKIADYLNKASILFSDNTLYLAWGLIAFIVILLIFVNIGYFGSFLRACGFPAFIIGCIYFLAALAVDPILSLIKIPNAAIASVVDFTVGFIVAFLMDISLIVAAAGLGMIMISLIADAIKRKINKE